MTRNSIFPIGIGLAIIVLSVSYGFQYLFVGADKLLWFSVFTLIFCVVLVLLGLFALRARENYTSLDGGDFKIIGPTLCFSSIFLTIFFNMGSTDALILLAILAVVISVVWSRFDALLIARSLFVVAIVFFVYQVITVPLDPNAADMLPIIKAAGAYFLDGSSPYGVIFPDSSVFPFVYLPGTWVPYLPLIALDLDLRILNVAGLVILAFLAEASFRKVGSQSRALSVAVYPLLMSPMIAQSVVHGQVWPYWIMVAFLGYFLLNRRLVHAAFVLGLMLATRQWAVFFAWPLAIYLIGNLGVIKFLRLLLVALAGFSLLLLPIFIFDPNLFQVAFVDVAKNAPISFLNEKVTSQVGLVALMSAVDLVSAPIVLMSFVAVIVAFTAYRSREISLEWFVFFMGWVYVLFVTCNFQVFRYYYIPGLWFMAVGYVAIMSQGEARKVTNK